MKQKNVTGRDGYIICKALAYAIAAIERLPEQWQEHGDREDMRALLNAVAGHGSRYFMTAARAHLERRGVTAVDGEIALADRPTGAVVEFPG
jgi:hypothetical protein